jgi:hypothetical protein
MFFKVINMTTIKVPPLKEPEGEICSIHGIVEVEEPRMAMILILYEEGIKPCLLVIPICVGGIEVLGACAVLYWEGERLIQGLSPIFRMDDFVNNACRVSWFSVIRM